MRNKIIPYHPKLKEYARYLRKNSTLSEILLWKEIKNKSLSVEFHRQVPILEFIVDFYCHELSFAIEINGNSHLYKYEYDMFRQGQLEIQGVTFLRIDDEEVKRNIQNEVIAIQSKVEEISAKDS